MVAVILADDRASRTERRDLSAWLADPDTPDSCLAGVVRAAFAWLGSRPSSEWASAVPGVEELVRATIVAARRRPRNDTIAQVLFSPGSQCRDRLVGLLDGASRTADVCVYTLTDDFLAAAVLRAHRRGLRVRLITEFDTVSEAGSDVTRLRAQGIPVKLESGTGLLHHKFTVLDGRLLATGSYNWTRNAAAENHDNLTVLSDPRVVAPFARRFDVLWESIAP